MIGRKELPFLIQKSLWSDYLGIFPEELIMVQSSCIYHHDCVFRDDSISWQSSVSHWRMGRASSRSWGKHTKTFQNGGSQIRHLRSIRHSDHRFAVVNGLADFFMYLFLNILLKRHKVKDTVQGFCCCGCAS